MDKLTELCEFLAWVQDNYIEEADDSFITTEGSPKTITREEVVTQYLKEKGVLS